MRPIPLLFISLVLAGCGSSISSLTRATTSAAPDDAFICVQEKLKGMGYQRKSYDRTERWYVGQKPDPKARLADVRFRQRVNRLGIRVRPDASGNSTMEISAQSFDQFDNQQGFSETEVSASDQVKLDAQALVQACGK